MVTRKTDDIIEVEIIEYAPHITLSNGDVVDDKKLEELNADMTNMISDVRNLTGRIQGLVERMKETDVTIVETTKPVEASKPVEEKKKCANCTRMYKIWRKLNLRRFKR